MPDVFRSQLEDLVCFLRHFSEVVTTESTSGGKPTRNRKLEATQSWIRPQGGSSFRDRGKYASFRLLMLDWLLGHAVAKPFVIRI